MDQRTQAALQHLQEAVAIAADLGLDGEPLNADGRDEAVQNRLTDLEATKTTAIASTLSRTSYFDDLVSRQVSRAEVASDHVRSCATLEGLAETLARLESGPSGEDGATLWQAAAGQLAAFEAEYGQVGAAALRELEFEQGLQEAYREFRSALKAAEGVALDLLETAFAHYNTSRQKIEDGGDHVEQRPLIERLAALQDAERRWGVARDVANRLVTAAADADIVMARLMQSTAAKERLYWQSQAFIGAVSTVLGALPQALRETSEGTGPADSVRALRSAVVQYLQRTQEAAEEIERLAAGAAREIEEIRHDSATRLERLTPPPPAG